MAAEWEPECDTRRKRARGVRSLSGAERLSKPGTCLARVGCYIELAFVLALQYSDCRIAFSALSEIDAYWTCVYGGG